jgi:hypothetical protein
MGISTKNIYYKLFPISGKNQKMNNIIKVKIDEVSKVIKYQVSRSIIWNGEGIVLC